jgi:hypothetical protein
VYSSRDCTKLLTNFKIVYINNISCLIKVQGGELHHFFVFAAYSNGILRLRDIQASLSTERGCV